MNFTNTSTDIVAFTSSIVDTLLSSEVLSYACPVLFFLATASVMLCINRSNTVQSNRSLGDAEEEEKKAKMRIAAAKKANKKKGKGLHDARSSQIFDSISSTGRQPTHGTGRQNFSKKQYRKRRGNALTQPRQTSGVY